MASTPRDGSDHLESHTHRAGGWRALTLAVVAPLVVGYFGVVRPTTTQLSLVRDQVARLESTLHDLRATTPSAARAVGLLTRLGELEAVAARAELSLSRIDRLQVRVTHSVARAERAAAALDSLDELRERVDRQTDVLEHANAALATLASLPAELEASIGDLGRARASVARVRQLRERVEEADRLAGEAMTSVDSVADAQRDLLVDADDLASATQTLEGLTRLESRLNAPLMAVDASHERLDELMRLKDSVVARTADLPEAFETLELMVDLSEDYRRTSGVFRTLQRLMADLVLLEPSIARLASVVEPMIDRTRLTALGGAELRMVLNELRRRQAEAIAEIDAVEEVAGRPTESASK